jgi:hypothetical protein
VEQTNSLLGLRPELKELALLALLKISSARYITQLGSFYKILQHVFRLERIT